MRLPIISEEQAVGQGVAPQASMAQFAQVGAAGQALAEQTSQSALAVTGQFARIEQEKARIRQSTEAMDLFLDASKATTALHLALKTSPDRDSKTHLDRFDQGFKAIQEEVASRTTDPGVQGAVGKLLKRLYLEESTKALREADSMFIDEEKAALGSSIAQMEQAAGNAPTEQGRDFYLNLGKSYIDAKRGVLSEVEIQKQKTDLEQTVYGNAARRAIDADPMGANVEELIKKLPLTEQTRMGEYQTRKQEATYRERARLQEKQDKEDTRLAEQARMAAVDSLDDLADRGLLTEDGLRQAKDDRVAIGVDYRRLSDKVRNRQQAGGRTDDAVYNRLELDLLQNPLSHSASEIRRIQSAGNLAASGPRSAATLLKLVGDAAVAEAGKPDKDITKNELFQQGLRDLNTSLRGGKGPLESLTGLEQGRLENALREYHDLARSGKVPVTELPERARKIIDQKRKDIASQMGGDPSVQYQLRYTNPKDLLNAHKAGLIPDAEFNRQMDKMKALGLIPTGAPKTESPGGGR